MSQTSNFSRLPPLKSLRGFEATARLHSASLAAKELHLTPPAITHQIHKLEQYLGTSLFIREGRTLTLTDAGKAFYPYVYNALDTVAEGIAKLDTLTNRPSPLQLQVYVTPAIRWFAPRLRRFQQHSPGVSIQINSCAISWDFDPEVSDVGFIYAAEPPKGEFQWHPLFPCSISPVCAPSLMDGLRLDDAETLLTLPLLSVYTEVQYWTHWFQSQGIQFDAPATSITVDTQAIALEMACNGDGIALINGPFVERELNNGTLIRPSSHQHTLGDWGLIYPKNSKKIEQITTLLTWLKHEAATSIMHH